jgi:hypothetical protein
MEIIERVSTLETDVAVIQSNYVRRDEFSELRDEVSVGFAKTNGQIDQLRTEINGKIDQVRQEMHTAIAQASNIVLKWVFASQISVAAMFIAAIKYL